ncbi:MAG TPA: LytTR family DNA-binding domain-containing protein [Balneolaceae bacterium]|nr:LytTR family DNA-binding domain-containing protein [Balneolaceae bacterium]
MQKPKDHNRANNLSGQYLQRILIKNEERNIFIDVHDIHWVESSGNYVKLHLSDTIHMIRGSLKRLQEKLNPLEFVRIHRSYIVNIYNVKAIEPWFSGDSKVILNDGKNLKMSRNYKDNLERFKI